MDLDEAADALYSGSPDDFVEQRKALVGAARAAKDRELVKQIGALRRPTRSAWLVNRVARQAPEEVAALLDLGTALQDAQRRMDGDRLRELSKDRRRAVDALTRRAVELGREQDYTAPEAAVQEVSQTLQAALSDPDVGAVVRRGVLTQATTYGGFGPDALLSALSASLPTRRGPGTPPTAPAPGTPAEPEADEPAAEEAADETAEQREQQAREAAARDEAERARAAARESHDEAQRALADGEREAAETTSRADDLADRVEQLRVGLRQAEAEERDAREEARAARRRLVELRRAAAEAAEAAEALSR